MSREEIRATVIDIFTDLLDDDSVSVDENTSRENNEEWDSLFHMALMATIAEEFSVQFKTEDIVQSHDLKSIIDLVENLAS